LPLVFSNGVTEAPDGDEKEFGEARLERVLRDRSALSASALCDTIVAAVLAYQGGAPQEDDMTVVVAKAR
jgi:sigma-B regulation protein RsbU (phosphoserine phosphatase)